MAKRRTTTGGGLGNVSDYRHEGTKRKNIPPAKLAAEGTVPVLPTIEYSYSPRRPPVLRFDSSGDADKLPELLATARKRKLTDDEVRLLAEALRTQEPWLEWAGKREMPGFAVDPVALHIHERVSAQAILKIAARQDVARTLFGDPEQEYREAVQFYRHDIDWTNRLILGDSLQAMASLAKREDLAGKVQMIYIDPPYGIRYPSNFQPEVGKRDVKDKEQDLTREAEMVKAYRDTWHLGIHSYLTYLRDRLVVARDLLADSGSVFVEISDENTHSIRSMLDEVFGRENFVREITVKKTTTASGDLLASISDYLLWYCKSHESIKYRQLYFDKEAGSAGATQYTWVERPSGELVSTLQTDLNEGEMRTGKVFAHDNITSQRPSQGADLRSFSFEGRAFSPGKGTFKSDLSGLQHLAGAGRLMALGDTLRFVRRLDDFAVSPISNLWIDTVTSGFSERKVYVVQTNPLIVKRRLLMTTDPGDLVLDPTCGSGTMGYVAEQWGRRWITIDTSRVAVAIARQRVLTAKYDYFQLRDEKAGVAGNFRYKTVPHITLKSIAQNANLDPIFAEHDPILDAKLSACNVALVRCRKTCGTRSPSSLCRKIGVRASVPSPTPTAGGGICPKRARPGNTGPCPSTPTTTGRRTCNTPSPSIARPGDQRWTR